MNPAPFDPGAYPAILDARARSAAVNTDWSRTTRAAIDARFDGLETPEAIVDAGRALLADSTWVERLFAPMIDALRKDPWFAPGLRVNRDALRTGIIIADCAQATLSATVTSAAALAQLEPPGTMVIAGRWSVTRYVRGGQAEIRRWRAPPAGFDFSARTAEPARTLASRSLEDGDILVQSPCEGHLIVAAHSDIVTLTFTAKRGAAPLMREYATRDGAFVRASCGEDRTARAEMLLSFLRASGRSDAGTQFERESRHPAFHQRWAAMREWLMLDARAARPRLAEMAAADPNDEVRAAAAATLATLDQRLTAPCPA
ncbi:hypothetical protein FPZ54_14780 [Sphingomonas suaedae]|uniref:HEAT repeat domain-containing protein n=1 Tax=Sphingomonas suaedae TaxID=2599297 RepID=A0A518RI89_9SPHN|nr:hypothetical protein [Sphingomonas suaedae]QDX27140.1 hypothetical protein FPZ54_14780 [Sphingomonas suaedae]